MKKNHLNLKTALVASAFIVLLSACGSSSDNDFKETSIEITKKGNINNTIIESFDKDYYNEDELKQLIDEEVLAFCTKKGNSDAAVIKSFKVDDGDALADFRFMSCDDYAEFNDVEFFYGTVGEAIERGYEMDVILKNVDDDDTIGKTEIESMTDKMIVIVSESIAVTFPEKLIYTTANIDILGKNSGRMSSESSGLGYMILDNK